jgi:hypothetical protein
MKFNDTINNSGICQDVWHLTGTNSTSFPTSDIARITNKVMRELAVLAWRFSTVWKFDDQNLTTHNIAELTLVNSQGDYELPSVAFDVERVEVVDTNNNINYKLEFIKETDIKTAIPELEKNDGIPKYYFLRGESIWLKPEPDTNKVSKLVLYLSRDISEFSGSDTNKEPGIPSVLHPIVPYMVALEYAGANNLSQLTYLNKKVDEWKEIFRNYFVNRGGESKDRISPLFYDFK